MDQVFDTVLTPIAAHMVFDRSFVLDPGSEVSLEVMGEESGILSADASAPVPEPAALPADPPQATGKKARKAKKH